MEKGKRKRNSFPTVITATCVSKYMIWQVMKFERKKTSYLQTYIIITYSQHRHQSSNKPKDSDWPLGHMGAGLLFSFNLFYWSIIDSQCCVNFCSIAEWFSYTHITSSFIFFSVIIYHRILNTGYWIPFPALHSRTLLLSILYTIICIY